MGSFCNSIIFNLGNRIDEFGFSKRVNLLTCVLELIAEQLLRAVSQSFPNTFHKSLFPKLFSVTFKEHQLRYTENYLNLLNKEDLNPLPSPYLYVRLVWELVIQIWMRQQLFWGVTVSRENLLIDSNTEENVCGTETNAKAYHSTNMLPMSTLQHYVNPLSFSGPVWCMVWSSVWVAWFLSIFYVALQYSFSLESYMWGKKKDH